MIALVSRVNPPQQSKKGGFYQKIEMILKPENTWCYTYISSTNHNFGRWEKIVNSPHSIWVENVQWKDECKRMIDADSRVIYHNRKHEKRNPIDQLELF